MAGEKIRRIGISTGGGDCPGLNAVIRAVTLTAHSHYGWEVVGIKDSFKGLVWTDQTMRLSPEVVKDILPRGGTILGTTNRGNPFAWEREKNGKTEVIDMSDRILENFEHLELDAMVIVGGDGTMKIAKGLFDKGMPVVGVPKTIDNDLEATDLTFGFNSAVRAATEVLDKLRTTAESHHRVMVVEMMGREAGWISLHAGFAGEAHVVLIPEIPFDPDIVCKHLLKRWEENHRYSLVVVAEGAKAKGKGAAVIDRAPDGTVRLGGIADQLAATIRDRTELDVRVVVVGHIQRGGSPTEYDRILATRYGEAATHMIAEGKFGKMVALRGTAIVPVDLEEAVGRNKLVYPDGTLVKAARSMGVSFGDV